MTAILLSAVVALGFALFAIDETDHGSKTQQAAIDQKTAGHDVVVPPAPNAEQEALREKQHSRTRETIDDANDVLLRPFSGVVGGIKDVWVVHGIPALLALLVYGPGFGLLANLLPRAETHAGDWRTA